MSKKKIVKDKDGKPVEIDQDAIDAALAGAVTMEHGGGPVPGMQPPADPKPAKAPEKKKEEKKADEPISSDQKKFGEDCFNLNIDAKKCHYQSAKNQDQTILGYVRSINKKIYDETCVGGFSTNVQFRVTPQDWVNVSHIKDWYKARGFQVEDRQTTAPAYGKEVGYIDYNFTISWANV